MIIKDVSAAELEVMEIIWAAGKPVIITDIWQAIEEIGRASCRERV